PVSSERPLEQELLHFSQRRLGKVKRKAQDVVSLAPYKPNGLWLSVGRAWPEWCAAGSCAGDRFQHVARIALADDANILRLASALELQRFTEQYGHAPQWATPPWNDARCYQIDWRAVAEKHDGIVIAPYI